MARYFQNAWWKEECKHNHRDVLEKEEKGIRL